MCGVWGGEGVALYLFDKRPGYELVKVYMHGRTGAYLR